MKYTIEYLENRREDLERMEKKAGGLASKQLGDITFAIEVLKEMEACLEIAARTHCVEVEKSVLPTLSCETSEGQDGRFLAKVKVERIRSHDELSGLVTGHGEKAVPLGYFMRVGEQRLQTSEEFLENH